MHAHTCFVWSRQNERSDQNTNNSYVKAESSQRVDHSKILTSVFPLALFGVLTRIFRFWMLCLEVVCQQISDFSLLFSIFQEKCLVHNFLCLLWLPDGNLKLLRRVFAYLNRCGLINFGVYRHVSPLPGMKERQRERERECVCVCVCVFAGLVNVLVARKLCKRCTKHVL